MSLPPPEIETPETPTHRCLLDYADGKNHFEVVRLSTGKSVVVVRHPDGSGALKDLVSQKRGEGILSLDEQKEFNANRLTKILQQARDNPEKNSSLSWITPLSEILDIQAPAGKFAQAVFADAHPDEVLPSAGELLSLPPTGMKKMLDAAPLRGDFRARLRALQPEIGAAVQRATWVLPQEPSLARQLEDPREVDGSLGKKKVLVYTHMHSHHSDGQSSWKDVIDYTAMMAGLADKDGKPLPITKKNQDMYVVVFGTDHMYARIPTDPDYDTIKKEHPIRQRLIDKLYFSETMRKGLLMSGHVTNSPEALKTYLDDVENADGYAQEKYGGRIRIFGGIEVGINETRGKDSDKTHMVLLGLKKPGEGGKLNANDDLEDILQKHYESGGLAQTAHPTKWETRPLPQLTKGIEATTHVMNHLGKYQDAVSLFEAVNGVSMFPDVVTKDGLKLSGGPDAHVAGQIFNGFAVQVEADPRSLDSVLNAMQYDKVNIVSPKGHVIATDQLRSWMRRHQEEGSTKEVINPKWFDHYLMENPQTPVIQAIADSGLNRHSGRSFFKRFVKDPLAQPQAQQETTQNSRQGSQGTKMGRPPLTKQPNHHISL